MAALPSAKKFRRNDGKIHEDGQRESSALFPRGFRLRDKTLTAYRLGYLETGPPGKRLARTRSRLVGVVALHDLTVEELTAGAGGPERQ